MAKGAFNFFELHAEKIVLGVVGAFLLAMVWMYMISTPNKVEFDGKQVGPDELDQAIASQADQLQQRVRNLKAPEVNVPDFSSQLRKLHESGLFAAAEGSPQLSANLRRSIPFGPSIVVPGLESVEARIGTTIASISALKTDPPVVETGRSMVIAVPASFEDVARNDDKKPAAVEQPWVTVATYFDRKAQQDAMIAAGYPEYRARVFIAGVDVQRQELRADGTWADWADVQPSQAMPKLTIPEPVLDEATGAIKNREDIDRAFELVQANQQRIIQPTYFNIDAGDTWVTPPLEGHEPEEVDEADEAPKPKPPKEKPEVRPPPGPRPPVGVSGGRGGRGATGRGGGGSDVVGGSNSRAPTAPQVDAKTRREQEKQADADLKEAQEAFKDKDYALARNKAQEAANSEYAKKSTKDKAESLLKEVEEAEAKLAQQAPTNPRGGNVRGGGGDVVVSSDSQIANPRGGGMRGMGGSPAAMQVAELVTHPVTDAPAVWFHDDSVDAGKTYRYRMRVNIWNRYVGQPRAFKNPADAQKTVIAGEWSDAGEPVTTVANSFFFVKGPRAGNEAASIEVWKFLSGTWHKENFDVAIGDVIGGVKKIKSGDDDRTRTDVDFSTGAVVLDLRFNDRVKVRNAPSKDGSISYRDLQTLVMVYYDPADGQVKEKNAIMDKDDPMRRKLDKGS